jgi:hypothetical protein
MRAWDLAVFIILIEMSLGFLSGLHGFYTTQGQGLYHATQGGAVAGWQQRSSTDEFVAGTEPGGLNGFDYLNFAIMWVLASFWMIITVLKAFFVISWDLYFVFGLPASLCAFIQGIVYLIYTWAFVQWKSGRGGQAFE